jgi:hypothetical protein
MGNKKQLLSYLFIWAFCLFGSSHSWSITSQHIPPVSASRAFNETSMDALRRYQQSHPLQQNSQQNLEQEKKSVIDSVTDLEKINFQILPEWKDLSEVTQNFDLILNDRFLSSSDGLGFKRRIPWLYPDDGCFMRTQSALRRMQDRGISKEKLPKKIFIFGDLVMTSQFSPNNQVYWWFHVVPAVRLKDEVYVLDPTVESAQPLTIHEWILKLVTHVSDVRIAVCDTSAYDAFSNCHGDSGLNANQRSQEDAPIYLDAERRRIEDLGFNPNIVLRDFPPWR